jgi:hypothetical protein
MSQNIKVKILDMQYDRSNNLFIMEVKELEAEKRKVKMALSGSDFGIYKNADIPSKIIDDFCNKMCGQEKNLEIKKIKSDIPKKEDIIAHNSNGDGDPMEQILKAYDDTMGYPIADIKKYIEEQDEEK